MEQEFKPLTEEQLIAAEKGELKLKFRNGEKVDRFKLFRDPSEDNAVVFATESNKKLCAHYRDGRVDRHAVDPYDVFVDEEETAKLNSEAQPYIKEFIPLNEEQLVAAEKGELKLKLRNGVKVTQLMWSRPPYDQNMNDVLTIRTVDGACISNFSDGRFSDEIGHAYDLFIDREETDKLNSEAKEAALKGVTEPQTRNYLLERLRLNTEKMVAIAEKKNHDYGGTGADPFRNFKAVEEIGICGSEKGILVRMTDKLCRISSLIDKEGKVKDESIEDTLIDLANYALILEALITYKKLKDDTGNNRI